MNKLNFSSGNNENLKFISENSKLCIDVFYLFKRRKIKILKKGK